MQTVSQNEFLALAEFLFEQADSTNASTEEITISFNGIKIF